MTINWDKLQRNVEKITNKNLLTFKRRKNKEFNEAEYS